MTGGVPLSPLRRAEERLDRPTQLTDQNLLEEFSVKISLKGQATT
jgi:hypothetical protein